MELFALLISILSLLPFFGMGWADSANATAALSLSVSDSFALSDFTPVTSLSYRIIADDDNLNAYGDATNKTLGTGATPLTQTAADNLDAYQDSSNARIVGLLSQTDNLNAYLDSSNARAAGLLSQVDTLNAYNDAVTILSAGKLAVSDTAPTFADAADSSLGSGSTPLTQTAADSLALSDVTLVVGLNYRLTAVDSFTLADSPLTLTADYLAEFADSANNWADSSTQDNAAVTADLTKAVSDSFTLSDAVALFGTEPKAVSDSFTLADGPAVLRANLLLAVADSLPSAADSSSQRAAGFLSVNDALTITDEAAAATDAPEILKSFSDSFTLSDSGALRAAGSRSVTGDALTFTDAAVKIVGNQRAVSDSFTLSDAAAQKAAGLLSVSDSLSLWVDTANVPNPNLTLVISDSFTLIDAAVTFNGTPSAIVKCPQIGAAAIVPEVIAPVGISVAITPNTIASSGSGVATVPGVILATGAGTGTVANAVASVGGAAIISSSIVANAVGAAVLTEPIGPAGLVVSLQIWGQINGC